MDEILVSNFSIFQDLVDTGDYDAVVGDEAWDIDYFWHENPELKRSAYIWMTDFVGWLPAPGTDANEVAITADYNAEMIEHIARFRRVRDRSIFIGDPEDIAPHPFGPDLPLISAWTKQHYEFSGYVSGFTPPEHHAAREALGYPVDVPVVVVTVGGSGVGRALLEKIISAFRQFVDRSATYACSSSPAHASTHGPSPPTVASTSSATSATSPCTWRPATRRLFKAG